MLLVCCQYGFDTGMTPITFPYSSIFSRRSPTSLHSSEHLCRSGSSFTPEHGVNSDLPVQGNFLGSLCNYN
jgi:hypothetical protein